MEHTNVYLRRTCLPNGCGIARATTCLLPCWLSLRIPDGHCRIASHSAPTDTKPETAYILCSKSPSSFRGAPIAAFHPSVLPSLQPPCNSTQLSHMSARPQQTAATAAALAPQPAARWRLRPLTAAASILDVGRRRAQTRHCP